MAMPTLTHTGQRLYDALAPLAFADAEHDYPLAKFCGAVAAGLDEVADLWRDDDDGTPGLAKLFNPDTCPVEWLPWVGQFVGVQFPQNLSEDAARLRLKRLDGFKRGTPDAIINAAKQHLQGPDGTPESATVTLNERDTSPYHFSLTIRDVETLDYDAVYNAVLEQKPAGLLFSLDTEVVATIDMGTVAIDDATGTIDTADISDIT
jgi:hypothetical protein